MSMPSVAGRALRRVKFSSRPKFDVFPSRVDSAHAVPSWHRCSPQIAYLVLDLLFAGSALFTTHALPVMLGRPLLPQFSSSARIPLSAAGVGAFYVALVLLFCQSEGLYHTRHSPSEWEESGRVVKAVALATVLMSSIVYLTGSTGVSRSSLALSGVGVATWLVGWRLCRQELVRRRAGNGCGARNVLIVGAGRVGQALATYLEENRHLGYAVKGFLDHNRAKHPRVLGSPAELSRIGLAQFADEVFITVPSERRLVEAIAREARQRHWEVNVIAEMYDGLAWRAPIRYLGDFAVMQLHREPIPALGLVVKRIMDLVASLAALMVVAPAIAVLGVLAQRESPGPIFYRSLRVGKKGRTFTCWKLRTMVANADELKSGLRQRNERHGPCFKISDDPRVTRLGKILRKYSLDELPQLYNVLKGEMSLVGPRPHPLDDYRQYSLEHLRRLDVKPGLTGLWQVTARQEPSFEKGLALDLGYIEHWSLCLDLRILLRTFPAVLSGSGT